MYGATVAYIALYHRQQIAGAVKQIWRSTMSTLRFRKHGDDDEVDEFAEDIHYRLMKQVSFTAGAWLT